jgi:hypothetical protein
MRVVRIAAGLVMASACTTVVACDALIGLDSLKDRPADGGDEGSTGGRDGTVPSDGTSPDSPEGDSTGNGDTGSTDTGSDGTGSGGEDVLVADTGGPDTGSKDSSAIDAPADVKVQDQGAPPPDTGTDAVMDAGVDAYEACVPIAKAVACGTMECGTASDGCNGKLVCGTCALPLVCGGDGVPNTCGDPDAGCTPAARFTIMDVGNGNSGSGTGLVYDSMTGLTWMRFAYYDNTSTDYGGFSDDCLSRNMRLPTLAEGKALANAWDSCAWPAGWDTWTSTTVQINQIPPLYAYEEVGSNGIVNQAYFSNYKDVLCVTP